MQQTVTLADAAPIATGIAAIIIENQALLSEIDGATGDGDHGINMAKGFRLVIERLESKSFDLREGFATIGDTLLGDIGGSMGPLYGSFFTEMAEALDGTSTLDRDRFAAMLSAGEAAIVDLGEAKVGDKTLIDVLVPARDAFIAAAKDGRDFAASLQALQTASAAGLEGTRDMVARLGRAARLGERSRGTLDAGACSCNLILQALADGLLQRLEPA
ncbi:dihydroxyacetone kinase subunit DhaL [Lichenicoccus sp.]|uniref:dihydroxyacetone kinase subunit DhaL n=1 Tax=Lichenicoccus sp. TaxID=2781899 RepID=UPI003D12788A